MRCPACSYSESKVVDSRPSDDGFSIRRRRECLSCAYRFTTYERLEDNTVFVVKSDGSAEAYNREKLSRGILKACAKRPVAPETIDLLVDSIEADLGSTHAGKISSKALGELALSKLREVDEVAYVRFASVYRDFQSVDEFREELERLR